MTVWWTTQNSGEHWSAIISMTVLQLIYFYFQKWELRFQIIFVLSMSSWKQTTFNVLILAIFFWGGCEGVITQSLLWKVAINLSLDEESARNVIVAEQHLHGFRMSWKWHFFFSHVLIISRAAGSFWQAQGVSHQPMWHFHILHLGGKKGGGTFILSATQKPCKFGTLYAKHKSYIFRLNPGGAHADL